MTNAPRRVGAAYTESIVATVSHLRDSLPETRKFPRKREPAPPAAPSPYPGEVADETNSTLVEFFLEPEDDGTRLRVTESGFATLSIPAEREGNAGYDSHDAGWREVTGNLKEYAEK